MPYQATTAQRPRRFRTGRTVVALVLREMSTTYGRSALGYVWALLEPVAGILLLSVVFSVIAHSPPVGASFALFHASGLLPFMMYLELSNKISSALRFSQPLLFYPGVTHVDAILARLVLNGLSGMLVIFLVLTGIVLIEGLDVILDLPALLLSVAMTVALALGIGTLNCFLLSMFPVWERTWAILNRPLFIVSCIVFPFDAIPQPYRDWLWFNPITHLVGQMRKGIYATYDAAYVSPLYVFAVSGVSLLIGLVMLGRYKSYIINDG